ncbi:hypothetical protein H2200_004008 [Cladophialophora chaetospira]|uniref:Uncharacterized protein n=1 Tax=Cladophialophora chaetospira TaxID=386627 RepID=A0AA39CLK6_9EURO|nr:hypothetical protein H2200_004008 [Cladophialophora chaetospira]
MDFTRGPAANHVVDLTQDPGSEGHPPAEASTGQPPNRRTRQVLAYSPEEQEEYAAQGYVPVNTDLILDPNTLQMREFVYPGTWEHFNGIRYAGANDVALLEWQLARAYGLAIDIPQGDPRVRHFLRNHFRAQDVQGQQMQWGVLQQQQQAMPSVGAPATLSAVQTTISVAPDAGDVSQQQPQPLPQQQQNIMAAPTSSTFDSGMPIMGDPPTARPDLVGSSIVSRFVKNWNKGRGGRIGKARK